MVAVFMVEGSVEALDIIDFGVDVVPNIGEKITFDGSGGDLFEVLTKTWSLGEQRGIIYTVQG